MVRSWRVAAVYCRLAISASSISRRRRSIASGRTGAQLSAGAQRIGRTFSLGTSALLATRDYRDVASMNGSGVLRRQLSAFTGLNTRRFGSFGFAYVDLRQDSPVLPNPTDVQLAGNSRVVTANYSIQIHRASVYSSWFHRFGPSAGNGNNGLQVGMTFSFGRYRTASASAGSDGSWQAQVQQAAPQVGDWGYQLYTSGGDSTHMFAQGQYKSQVGLFTAGVDRDNALTSLRMESQSAISFVDKAVFASNEIYDSFAVVDTRPVTNVHVYQENRNVGTTGKTGRVLVPDMRAFDLNNISIEPTDIPGDATLGTDKRELRPQDRSGVIVKFPIRFSHSALLRLVDEAGVVVPQGSAATLRATGTVAPVGYDGEAYVEDLSPHNQLFVEYPDGNAAPLHLTTTPFPATFRLSVHCVVRRCSHDATIPSGDSALSRVLSSKRCGAVQAHDVLFVFRNVLEHTAGWNRYRPGNDLHGQLDSWPKPGTGGGSNRNQSLNDRSRQRDVKLPAVYGLGANSKLG